MPRDLPVTEVMTTDVLTLNPDDSVEDALRLLSDNDIRGAPVVDGDGKLVGLLDDSDLIIADARLHGPTMIEILGAYIPLPGERRRYEEELRHVLGRTVAELMDDEPPSVRPTSTVEDVATIMADTQVTRVPVVDDQRHIVGIVSRRDLVLAMSRDLRPDDQ